MRFRPMLVVVSLLLLATSAPALEQNAARTPDYATIKRQVEQFETLLDKALQQRFEQPFVILQHSKGTYLEGFGAVFTVEVNLVPMRFITPFNPAPYSPKELEEARAKAHQRIREVGQLVEEVLREHGPSLTFLNPEEQLAVVVHLFRVAENRELPSQIVVQARRQALLDAQAQNWTAAQFRQKLTLVTF